MIIYFDPEIYKINGPNDIQFIFIVFLYFSSSNRITAFNLLTKIVRSESVLMCTIMENIFGGFYIYFTKLDFVWSEYRTTDSA